MNEALLFLVGAAVVTFAWLGLVVLPRRVAQVEGLRAFAQAHGARWSGDGRRAPFTVVGVHRGRTFSVAWQPGQPETLLVAVDCEASDQRVAEGQVQDAALGTRWTDPSPDLLRSPRLDAILDSLTTMAEEIEAAGDRDSVGPPQE